MNFAILRTKKLKTIQQIQIAGMHNDRTLKVPNAHPDIGSLLVAGSPTPRTRYEELVTKLNIKERANGVKAIEIILTFSPEAKEHIPVKRWTEENITWLKKEFGSAAILSAQLHTDETTPHIHAIIIPVKKKKGSWRLCCRDFLGGASKLSALQDRYALAMAGFGLQRGLKRSKATHEEIKAFYNTLHQLENPQPAHALPKLSIWNYAKNNEGFKKLKSTTIELLNTISRIANQNTVLKKAYLKEREARKNTHTELMESEKSRSTLENQFLGSASREQHDQERYYSVVPIAPREKHIRSEYGRTTDKHQPSRSSSSTNHIILERLEFEINSTGNHESDYSEIPLSPLEKLELSIHAKRTSPSTSTSDNPSDEGTTSSENSNALQLAPHIRKNKKTHTKDGHNLSM